jgi:hypothetical protein
MTEEDARLALLQAELGAIQSAIRNLDTIDFQIKSWCVTTSLAIGGFAVAYKKPGLLAVGLGAIIGFYLVNCQFKATQRVFIKRNQAIDATLKKTGIMPVLRGKGDLHIVGTAAPDWGRAGSSMPDLVRQQLTRMGSEARLPNTFSLYLFIFMCLAAEAAILR